MALDLFDSSNSSDSFLQSSGPAAEGPESPASPAALRDALERKAARRRRLAALSFPEKIAIVVQLQARFAPIYRARGREYRVWSLEAEPPSSPGTPRTED